MKTKPRSSSKKKPPVDPNPRGVAPIDGATGTHMTYHAEAGLLRLHIVEDVKVGGETKRLGRDKDIALADLDSQTRSALSDAFKWACEDAGVEPYEPEE